jgi:hypothetical protein
MSTFNNDSEIIITRIIQYFNEFNIMIEHYNSYHLIMKEINKKIINREILTREDLFFKREYDDLTNTELDLKNIFNVYAFKFSKDIKQSQNLADFFIDKINNIDEYPSDLTLYSAYTKQTNIINKNLCWFTHRIDQSILFPFNLSRLDITNAETNEPHIYSFRLKQPLKLINSKSNHNMEIFDKFFPFGKYFYKKFIKFVFNEDFDKETFAVKKNKRILYIIEAINRFISSKKSRFQKIDGYKNDLDQCEIAVIGFSNLVDIQSIKEYKITKIGRTGNFFKLPIKRYQINDFFNGIVGGINYNIKTKSRITCPDNLIIKYRNTNGQEPEKIFNCSCMPIDVWQKKYLKYKTKYLKLKSFIG